ncbi:MAG: hypothetical protein P8O69_09510 [Amylibacter sp.]|nr:hypothetical protein [Amylibacter sp.]
MSTKSEKTLSPEMEEARNDILKHYGDFTFEQALGEVNTSLKTEKNAGERLVLLAAKSWIIRNKVHVLMHEPFVYTMNELENTDVFSDIVDDDDGDGLDGLFDDDEEEEEEEENDKEEKVQISFIKSTTRAGVKYAKDMIAEVSKKDAEELVSKKKAKYLDET